MQLANDNQLVSVHMRGTTAPTRADYIPEHVDCVQFGATLLTVILTTGERHVFPHANVTHVRIPAAVKVVEMIDRQLGVIHHHHHDDTRVDMMGGDNRTLARGVFDER